MLENLPIPQDEEQKKENLEIKELEIIENSSFQEKENTKKRNFSGLIILVVIAILGLIFGFFSIKEANNYSINPDNSNSISKLTNFSNKKYIATISIEGTIEEKNQTYDQEWLLSTIEELEYDSNNVGIMLKINSPGGTVYESDEVYLALLNYKTSGKPIFAYFESMAASGGYYIGCAADKIYANRNTLTGSIGVIYGQHLDLSKLLEKYGIDFTTITAGENKNMGNFAEPLTAEQKKILQSIADECYEQFTGIVAESRKMDIEIVKKLADGRVYTAKQALENNLIDGISTYDEAYANFFEYICENFHITKSINEVYFEPEYKYSFADYFTSVFSQVKNNKTQSTFSSIEEIDRSPVFYYQHY